MMRPMRLPRRGSQRRERAISIVPMINIVFLLLVFFLLTATIAPPDPVAVRLPVAEGREGPGAAEGQVLHVDADGTLALGAARGDAALAALAGWPDGDALVVRADADLDAAAFAALLARLRAVGVGAVSVVVLRPGAGAPGGDAR